MQWEGQDMSAETGAEQSEMDAPHGERQPMIMSQVDVARLAGVSQAAVSRTFTPGASVSEETRAKVLAAAERLGYRPNVIARSLIRKSTNMIGLVVMKFTNPFYARMIRDFTRALQDLGYWTLLFNIASSDEVEDALPTALQYQVDGLIITSATLSSRLAEACSRAGTPVVLFNRYAPGQNVNIVRCDGVQGGRLVADALLDAGHRRIAYVAGEEQSSTNRERELGFSRRLAERGHVLALRESGDFSYESGYAAGQRLLGRDDPPDAVFCASDLMAMGVLDVARHDCRIAVPDELSVVGFDDISMACWPAYSLTTIRQPVDEMVELTVQVLEQAIQSGNSEVVTRVLSPSLVVRGSARVAGAQDPASGDLSP